MLFNDESSLSGTVIRAIHEGGVSSDGLVDGEAMPTCYTANCKDRDDDLSAAINALDGPLMLLPLLLKRNVLAGVESDEALDQFIEPFLLDAPEACATAPCSC